MAKAVSTPTTSRRKLLQGGAVLAAAAIVPIASRANVATPIIATNAKVHNLGEECLRQAATTKALGLRKAAAYDATEAAMAGVPKWVLDYVVGGPLSKWPSWRAAGRNCADDQ